MSDADDVEAYLASVPQQARPALDQVRRAVHDALPGCGERRSYGIVGVTVDGKVALWFGGFTDHVSVYPVPGGDAAFEAEIAPYRAGKGTLRFALDQPVPVDLVGRVATMLDAARRDRQA